MIINSPGILEPKSETKIRKAKTSASSVRHELDCLIEKLKTTVTTKIGLFITSSFHFFHFYVILLFSFDIKLNSEKI